MEVQAVSLVATAPETSPRVAGPGPRFLGTAAGVFLGAVFLVAAYAKALDPVAFAEQIRGQGLAGWFGGWPAPETLVYLVLGAEVALGVLLVSGVRRWWVLVPAAALVAMFVFLTGRDAWLDSRGLLPADAACGCFGNLLERTPAEAFRQDLLMLVPSLALALVGRPPGRRRRQAREEGQGDNAGTRAATSPQRLPRARIALAALATGVTVLFTARAPALPLDDLATRLKPGVEIAGICAGRGAERICLETLVPELGAGDHLVVLADLADPGMTDAARQLNAYVNTAGYPSGNPSEGVASRPRPWLLTASPSPDVAAFFWKVGPTFEIREAPLALLRPLYRALPRAFLVRAGRVLSTHTGWSEVAKLIAPSGASS